MSKNIVERTEACHVVSCVADPTKAIPKGTAVVIAADYFVTIPDDQDTFAQGVTLEAHASGVHECVPVVLPGPVLRVTIGEGGVDAGNLVNGDFSEPGEWIVDNNDSAGFALEDGDDGDEADICFIGEQY
jgi:hypothetical protein